MDIDLSHDFAGDSPVPRISAFYGISVYLYYGDHDPPHVHARYSGRKGSFMISDGSLLVGELPVQATRLLRTWIDKRRLELMDRWHDARAGICPQPVPPLE